MRECPKCHKLNLATRKFCIRCGASLLKPLKPVETITKPTPEPTTHPSTTRITADESPSPTTQDKWVRPSQVSRDRVRHSSVEHSSMESEFEKAKRAFARAEEVGIDEVGNGIIETRMLRASEVKELIEGPGTMEGGQPTMISEETLEPPPDAEAPIHAPSSEDIEQQILGQWSTLVDREAESEPEPGFLESESPIRMSAADSTGFSSARYSDDSTKPKEEPMISPDIEPPPPPEPMMVYKVKEEPQEMELSAEQIITCPHCKNIITIDDFEYPMEIYSAMAQARLKQARFLIVQGREHDAKKNVKIARILFEKANDGDGIAQLEQLDATLTPSE